MPSRPSCASHAAITLPPLHLSAEPGRRRRRCCPAVGATARPPRDDADAVDCSSRSDVPRGRHVVLLELPLLRRPTWPLTSLQALAGASAVRSALAPHGRASWTRSSARNDVYGVRMPYFVLSATSSSTSSLFWPCRSIWSIRSPSRRTAQSRSTKSWPVPATAAGQLGREFETPALAADLAA